jgi:hypothetical protein
MRFLLETVIILLFGLTALFLYHEYWDDLQYVVFGDNPQHTIYVGSTAITVAVADEYEERVLGLSGVRELGDFDGKLFIFDEDAKHGIWMKDMLFALDIIWIDKDLRVVHIEENIQPDTYPSRVFAPQVDARFVLEVNAHFVSAVKLNVGDTLTLPPSLIPSDIKKNLQL